MEFKCIHPLDASGVCRRLAILCIGRCCGDYVPDIGDLDTGEAVKSEQHAGHYEAHLKDKTHGG